MNRWLNRLLHFCTHLPSSSDHSPAPAHRRPTVEAYQGRDSAVTDRTIPPANLPQEHRCQHGDCVTCLYQKAHHTQPPPSLFIKDILGYTRTKRWHTFPRPSCPVKNRTQQSKEGFLSLLFFLLGAQDCSNLSVLEFIYSSTVLFKI